MTRPKILTRDFFALILPLSLFVIHTVQSAELKLGSSLDIGPAMASLALNVTGQGVSEYSRTLSTFSGINVNYQVIFFNLNAIASVEFTQFQDSNLGSLPLTRLGLGFAYYPLKLNGQRMIMDNGVEAKSWGVTPGIELGIGLNKLSIKDPAPPSGVADFSASLADITPRLVVEIPISPSVVIVARGGYFVALPLSSEGTYKIGLTGMMASLNLRLSTW